MKIFLANALGNFWGTVVMSLFPLIELKGGIIFARGVGYGFLESLFLAYLGSTVVMIPVFFLLIPLLNLLKKIKFIDKLAYKTENYFKGKAKDTLDKQTEKQEKGNRRVHGETFLKQLGVFVFVAIPLPMTGVWTGTAIAVFLGMEFKDAVLPVAAGNLVAGLLIEALAELCIAVWTISSLDYILWGLFALAAILLIVTVIKISRSKPKSASGNGENANPDEKDGGVK